MGGPSGVGLGHGMPPPINQPGVGNVGGAQPTANVQRQGAPGGAPVQAEAFKEPLRAADMVGDLDVLLFKATKGGHVTKAAMEKAAKAAGLSKELKNELVALAKTAEDNIKALDAFSGKELAAAMEKKPDGTIVWKEGNAAGKALMVAQEAQGALSDALAKALGQAKDGDTQATLEEIMFQCDRRVAEIDTLVEQMTQIIDKGGKDAVDDAAKKLDGKISEYASENALDKFDRTTMLAALKADLQPLTTRLEAYSANGAENLTKADLDACKAELNALKAKFSALAAGKPDEAFSGKKGVVMDRAMLSQATKVIDETAKKLGALYKEVSTALMKKTLKHDFPELKSKFFIPKFADELAKLKSKEGKTGKPIADFIKGLAEVRRLASVYAENPTKANERVLLDAALEFENAEFLAEAAKLLDYAFVPNVKPGPDASEEFKEACMQFMMDFANDAGAENAAIVNMIKHQVNEISVAAKKLIELGKACNAGQKEKFYLSGVVLGAFKGEQSFSPLLESRVHGYRDSDVNLALDDKNVQESKELGSGMFNTVTFVKLKDGTEWVFKPEMPGRLASPRSPLNDNMRDSQELTRVNIAVQTTADALKLNDIMVKTTAGTHKGQFGMFMEKAPGLTGKKFKDTDDKLVPENRVSAFSILKMEDDNQFAKVVGRMMRQFNRLQWFDIITGQGDRHQENYLIDIKKDDLSVSVKAIDNDSSYGLLRTGIDTFKMPANSSSRAIFDMKIDEIVQSAKGKENQEALMDEIWEDPAITINTDGSIDIDLSKAKNPAILRTILHDIAFKSLEAPTEMDEDLYNELMKLSAKDGVNRKDYLKSLAERLGKGSEQYKCAVKRLDATIQKAIELKKAGKVYSATQWEDHDVQKEVAKPYLNAQEPKFGGEDGQGPKPSANMIAKIKKGNARVSHTNMFFRDFAPKLVGGSREHWFE